MFNSDTKDILDNLAKPQWVVPVPTDVETGIKIRPATFNEIVAEEMEAEKCKKVIREEMLRRYNLLLSAVQRKFDGESRFETALRYIHEAEKAGSDGVDNP